VKACVREIIAELGEELLLSKETFMNSINMCYRVFYSIGIKIGAWKRVRNGKRTEINLSVVRRGKHRSKSNTVRNEHYCSVFER
jgi:hypothetical protein